MKTVDEKQHLSRIYLELAECIGIENARIIHTQYQGQQINFPMNFYSREYIHTQIIKEFDGSNFKQLAAKYGCSERTVRRVLCAKSK